MSKHSPKFRFHGNYCGPGWCGGSFKEPCDFGVAPLDELDAVCKRHDAQYGEGTNLAEADLDAAERLKRVPGLKARAAGKVLEVQGEFRRVHRFVRNHLGPSGSGVSEGLSLSPDAPSTAGSVHGASGAAPSGAAPSISAAVAMSERQGKTLTRGSGTYIGQPNIWFGTGNNVYASNNTTLNPLAIGNNTAATYNGGFCGGTFDAFSTGHLTLFQGGTYKVTAGFAWIPLSTTHVFVANGVVFNFYCRVYDATNAIVGTTGASPVIMNEVNPGNTGKTLGGSCTPIFIVNVPPMGSIDLLFQASAAATSDSTTDKLWWDICIEKITHGAQW